jgi:hypothetical protein
MERRDNRPPQRSRAFPAEPRVERQLKCQNAGSSFPVVIIAPVAPTGPTNGIACLPRLPEVPPGQKLYPVLRFAGPHSRS